MACDAPLSIRYNPPIPDGKGGWIHYFPGDCGKCLKCLTKRKAGWSFRLTEEKRAAFSSYFITLTYNDKNLPWGDGVPSIDKNHHFEFIKNLKELESEKALSSRGYISKEEFDRRYLKIPERGKLRYYGISEYGDQFSRPHWHYILFNVRDIASITNAWRNSMRNDEGEKIYLDSKGKIDIDHDVNVNNIDYVLKYMIKIQNPDDYEKKAKEVSFYSKGLGNAAADEAFINSIRVPERNQVLSARGVKIPIPRYYRKKYLDDKTALKKNQYIAHQIEVKKLAQDTYFQVNNMNPDHMEKQGKDGRQALLKNRTKRNLE